MNLGDKPLNQTEPSTPLVFNQGVRNSSKQVPRTDKETSLVETVTILRGPKIFVARSFCGPQDIVLILMLLGATLRAQTIEAPRAKCARFSTTAPYNTALRPLASKVAAVPVSV